MAVDLNCDLGEGAGSDAELLALVSSANIACGAHAGDEAAMRDTVRRARALGVAPGAHPGYADREHFGRRELGLPLAELGRLVRAQVRRLQGIAAGEGVALAHVKPHGALYHRVAQDPAAAAAVAAAVADCGPQLRYFGLAGSAGLAAARAAGLRVVAEAFADRTYRADGSLTARTRPDALVSDEAAAVAQALDLVLRGRVRSVDGPEVAVRADTICLHGDGPHAVAFARRLRAALAAAGVAVRAPGAAEERSC